MTDTKHPTLHSPLPTPRVVGLGEVLWDFLPSGKSLGGAPANFAFHAQQLGARAAVVSCIGNDELGREMEQQFATLGLSTDYLRHNNHPTGTVTVQTHAGQPTYTIHTSVAWDFLPFDESFIELAEECDAVCFGSLAQRSELSRRSIQQFLAATRRDCLRIFDINLRENFFAAATIQASLAVADVLKLNDEELPVLINILQLPHDECTAIGDLMKRYPLRLIALTRGAQGSSLYSRNRISHHSGYTVKVVDTVGAGDAFSAALVMGLLRCEGLDAIHDRAAKLAAYVCSYAGGTSGEWRVANGE